MISESDDFPKQNCTVEDVTLTARICVPDFETKCNNTGGMTKRLEAGEYCYNVTRTVCEQVNLALIEEIKYWRECYFSSEE